MILSASEDPLASMLEECNNQRGSTAGDSTRYEHKQSKVAVNPRWSAKLKSDLDEQVVQKYGHGKLLT